MNLFIDDLRDPAIFHPNKEFKWIDHPYKAIRFMKQNKQHIVELHLDFHLNSSHMNGGDMFEFVAFDIPMPDESGTTQDSWPLLETIVLHSSEPQLFDRYIQKWMIDQLEKDGIDVIKAPLRSP